MVGHLLIATAVIFSGLTAMLGSSYLEVTAATSSFVLSSLLALFVIENLVLHADIQELRLANARDKEAATIKLALARSDMYAEFVRDYAMNIEKKARHTSRASTSKLRRHVSNDDFTQSCPNIMHVARTLSGHSMFNPYASARHIPDCAFNPYAITFPPRLIDTSEGLRWSPVIQLYSFIN